MSATALQTNVTVFVQAWAVRNAPYINNLDRDTMQEMMGDVMREAFHVAEREGDEVNEEAMEAMGNDFVPSCALG